MLEVLLFSIGLYKYGLIHLLIDGFEMVTSVMLTIKNSRAKVDWNPFNHLSEQKKRKDEKKKRKNKLEKKLKKRRRIWSSVEKRQESEKLLWDKKKDNEQEIRSNVVYPENTYIFEFLCNSFWKK